MDDDSEDDGIIEWNNDLSIKRLIWAYSNGIFPWPMSDFPLIPWVTPKKRGILRFEKLHLPKSLKKFLKNHPYQITWNTAFHSVIQECAERGSKVGTWISPEMIAAYTELHHQGFSYSAEVWRQNTLVGGIYGVLIEGVFAGESMFHREPNTSKLALLFLIEQLKQKNIKWIDIQMLTPHLEALGAEEVSRETYYELLRSAQKLHLQKLT